jgi:hypothetical protein
MAQHPTKQHGIHAAAKAIPPVDFHHRHASIEPLAQLWISVDVDTPWHDPMLLEHKLCLFTQMAPGARVKHHLKRFVLPV